MRHAEFEDEELAAVYDAECPWSRDDDYFVGAVGEPPKRVLDLGCGTGRLTAGLATLGHHVTRVDPAAASLARARRRPGGERVRWVHGTLDAAPQTTYDVALMTSHVAQFLIDDDEWTGTLRALARSLVAGGVLVFDSRDPADRAWEQWNPADSRRTVAMPDGSVVRIHTEVTDVAGECVSFAHHYVLGSRRVVSTATLRFRPEVHLRTALTAAGFVVDSVVGGWSGEPVGAGDGELIVTARSTG